MSAAKDITMPQIISCRPSIFAESIYSLEGKPFRLKNRKYLLPIYDGDSDEFLLMTGRQVEKSTTGSVHIANKTLAIPFFKALYVAPLNDQVKVFSQSRLGKLYEYSQQDIVKKTWFDRTQVNNVYKKTFSNGSENYFRHCFEMGDNIRGISTNGIWFDEVQDIHVDAIPVVAETQAHWRESGAGVKCTYYMGTPKTFANTIHQKWEKSSQHIWVVRCPHCNKWQTLGEANLSPDAFLCVKCRDAIPVEFIINGRYIALKPENELKGYNISQMMVPWVTPKEIYKKYKDYSKEKFMNEVLGRSAENSSKPFSLTTLLKMSANDFRLYNHAEGEFRYTKNFMGIDWGTGSPSYTVVKIYGLNNNGQMQLIYVKRFEANEELEIDNQINHIIYLANAFNVAYTVADYGFGYAQMQKLTRELGPSKFGACYYSFNLQSENKYDNIDNKWTVNRTRSISKYIEMCNRGRVVWPGADKDKYFDWLSEHHLVENSEYRSSSRTGRSEDLIYTHPEGTQDDGLHASVYAHIAKDLYETGAVNQEISFSGVYFN